ncbi:MAG: ADP-forming succinate--CoA ligase subunit beta [Myxococcota bacterium]
MKIHEFQAKTLFRRYGIAVPEGSVASSPQEAAAATEQLGGRSVVKAQIHAGGRGKGVLLNDPSIHGVKVCKSAQQAHDHAAALLGNSLHTHQTAEAGQVVKRVLVEALSDIKQELYAGLVIDRDRGCISFIASTEGGMDIEQVAAQTPEKILRQPVDPAGGLSAFHGRSLAYELGLSGDTAKQASKIFSALYKLFIETDASLVEINPLVVTSKGDVIALDAKMNFDDNALFRHPHIAELRDADEEDPKERRAKDAELSYVALDGNIGCLVNGAGLAMATMDIIKNVGGEPANFLDVGGGATAAQVTEAFKIILSDEKVKAILINIFGGIAKCDVIAEGVVTAAREVGLTLPLVVRLEGTNVEAGKAILQASGLAITPADDMQSAAQKVVAASQGGAA